MSANGHAYITVDEFDRYRSEVLRVSGEQTRVVKALEATTNQMAKLTETCRKLDDTCKRLDDKIDRKFEVTRRRLDSYSDLKAEERVESLVKELESWRALPMKILKVTGAVLSAIATGLLIAQRLGMFK